MLAPPRKKKATPSKGRSQIVFAIISIHEEEDSDKPLMLNN